jgi:hemoglobin-like flavoprotein
MALSNEDIWLVQDSLPLVTEHFEPASEVFYENLFAIAPELRSMFRDDLAGQGMRFMTTLSTIAAVLDNPEARAAQIGALAKGHAQLGIEPAHFAPMGSALLVTLGETLGPAFTPQLQQAWREAYDTIAAEMIALSEQG